MDRPTSCRPWPSVRWQTLNCAAVSGSLSLQTRFRDNVRTRDFVPAAWHARLMMLDRFRIVFSKREKKPKRPAVTSFPLVFLSNVSKFIRLSI